MPDSEFGSDGQLHDTSKPLSHLTEVEKTIRPDPVDHFEESEPASTAQRLRAFEDAHLGEDHLRHNHQVEKGSGSPFSNLSPAHKAHHAALEHLIEVEKEHADAEAKMGAVHAKLQAAIARAQETEEAL